MNELPEELKELESILIRIRPAKPDEVLMQTYLKIGQKPCASHATPKGVFLLSTWMKWGIGSAATATAVALVLIALAIMSRPSKESLQQESGLKSYPMDIAAISTEEPINEPEHSSMILAMDELGTLDLNDGPPIRLIRMKTLDYKISDEINGRRVIKTQAREQILPIRLSYH
jgi:hypothetical protein